MRIVLMHPPLDDPTLPYHSTAYLAGELAHKGFRDVSQRDVNIEFINYSLTKEVVQYFLEEGRHRFGILKNRTTLNFQEQEQYFNLSALQNLESDDIVRAADSFRDSEQFEEFPAYLHNLKQFTRYMGLLGALSYPAQIKDVLHVARGHFSNYNFDDLLNSELGSQICSPFERYFYEVIAKDKQFIDADLLGISIVYDHQMMHAMHLMRLLRKTWPEKNLVLGGTAISQCYKYLVNKRLLARLFDFCDAIVVGEGETAICEMAASGGNIAARTDLTNTVTYDRTRDVVHLPAIKYENVSMLGSPLYDHRWDLYLSPARGINYSPTRGCYWNRCTFCDYGLNTDSPTSPWRERKITDVIADLREAQVRHGVRYVYFAVDVMAPGYLERLSDAILAAKLDIRWSAELRMEKIFSAERCRKMMKAGCVCVSFGMESGNQRVLDLIDKGTKVQFMGETMRNFSQAGIAVQLMAFSDFPTETPEERAATIQFITENEPYWSTGGLGTFLLTGTSMIAKNPEKFGVTVTSIADADSARAMAFQLNADAEQRTGLVEEADASFDDTSGVFPIGLGRPWAGGTDTLHSMIYYAKYGRHFFKDGGLKALVEQEHEQQKATNENVVEGPLQVYGMLLESPYNLQTIINNRIAFCDYIGQRLAIPAEPTYASFQRWATNIPIEVSAPSTYWLTTGKKVVQLEKLVYKILTIGSSRKTPVNELLAVLPSQVADRLFNYLLELEEKGLLGFALRPSKMRMVLSDDVPTVRARALRLPSANVGSPGPSHAGLVQIAAT